MKQTKISEPIERNEQAIIEDIALESGCVLSAQQELAGLEARRSEMLASGAGFDAIRALDDPISCARLKVEIGEGRLDALDAELRRFRVAALKAQIAAELAPLKGIADEEREAVQAYEQHAKLVAAALMRLQALQNRREEVSQRINRINGSWLPPESKAYNGALPRRVQLPAAGAGGDIWPRTPYAEMLDEMQARAARDAAALAEYRGSE